MAADWIKYLKCLPDQEEVIGISNNLNLSIPEVVGHLLNIWAWADGVTRDGNVRNVTETFLDARTCEGFARAMASEGWLEIKENGGVTIPNFERHLSKSAKQRALTNLRVQRKRNAPIVTKALPEKRREEKRIRVCAPTAAHSGFTSDKKPPAETTKGGEPNPGFLAYRMACEAESITRCAFVPNYARDGKNLKPVMAELSEDEISARWHRFVMASLSDKFLGSHRSIAYFCSKINSWVEAPSAFDLEMESIRGDTRNPD